MTQSRTGAFILFGEVAFDWDTVKLISVTEEIDPIGATLPISVADITLYSEDAAFSILNPTGDYADFTYHKPLSIYAAVGESESIVFIGQYYLDTWESPTPNLMHLTCVDILGVLNTLPCNGGLWLEPTAVGEIIASLLDPIGVGYNLAPEVASIELTGWLPVSNYREALQQVVFAAGACVVCPRRVDQMKIGSNFLAGVTSMGVKAGVAKAGQSRVWQQRWRAGVWGGNVPISWISSSEKGIKSPVSLRTQVTGVIVTTHDFYESADVAELYNGTLTVGTHTIQFARPMHDLDVTGATIEESGANYAVLSVAEEGTVELTGYQYTEAMKQVSVVDEAVTEDVKKNVLSVDNATMVSAAIGETVAQRVYDYYQQRYLQKTRLFAPPQATGDVVQVEVPYDGLLIEGIIRKMEIDLAMGFKANVEIVGTAEED